MTHLKTKLLFLLLFTAVAARPPATLPGKELGNDTYMQYMINNSISEEELEKLTSSQSSSAKRPVDSTAISKSWAAPSIADQIARDTGSIKLGMGAVFVPRMSEEGAIEPDILIKDQNGKVLQSGQTGTKFNLLPGTYTIHIGSLAKLEITKEVYIEEGKVTPVIPDWCALRIEVIDENAKPIRGEYDLASLTPLEPIGRGRGRDIDLAEDLRIWFLPVGTYKIIGPGASLNSISNFLTVRLTTPGEFVRYSVVQDVSGINILGGGILIEDDQERKNRKWSHNINIGGSIDINYVNREEEDNDSLSTGLSLLLYDRFNMKNGKFEVSNLVKVDLSLAMDEFKLRSLTSNVDELRITSLFTYRLFSRLGPYARGEYISGILPKSIDSKTSELDRKAAAIPEHMFIFYDEKPAIISDEAVSSFDAQSDNIVTSPLFSPINLQAGTGINLQLFRNRIINSRLLTGFGIDYENRWDSWEELHEDSLQFDTSSQVYKSIYNNESILQTSLYSTDFERLDYGPELMLNSNFYLGRMVSIDNEVKVFFPFERFNRPDITIRNLLSLHLTGNLIIDYDYYYQLVQTEEVESQKDIGRHRILLRVSFSR
jgi:hypothetical protein